MTRRDLHIVDALRAAGGVGCDLLDVDWSATPLGTPDQWPPSLALYVRMMLGSRFSMWMLWGPDKTFLCNDAYRRATLGKKYPWALGRPAPEVWAEVWEEVSGRVDQVLTEGAGTWDKSLMLFLERSGFVEETYHTFSYSPLIDDDGATAGMLCVVSEVTEEVVGERRMSTLRALGSESPASHDEHAYLTAAARRLDTDRRSLPFTIVYLFDPEGATARLVASSGIEPGRPGAPMTLERSDDAAVWPVAELAAGNDAIVADLGSRFAQLPTGEWAQPPTTGVVLALRQPVAEALPYGFLVVGANRHRPLDDGYMSFLKLLAAQLSSGIAAARAYEAERQRAEQLAELERPRRAHEQLQRTALLLNQAERLADVGSWEMALATGELQGSDHLLRLLGLGPGEFANLDVSALLARVVHPDDLELVRGTLQTAITSRRAFENEVRLAGDGTSRWIYLRGEVLTDEDGEAIALRGYIQDITKRRQVEEAMRAAAAAREVAEHEHHIADALQRSLLPATRFESAFLEVATFYQAGVQGTRVGGDWYDVIDLGAGRTALVIGDVAGRGVRAASVMGQVRAAVRAYARLDLPPSEVLSQLDGMVRELTSGQIITCVYGVYEPSAGEFRYANAGHLPPLLARRGASTEQLLEATGPPLGAGPVQYAEQQQTVMPGDLIALYTDGLVERRDRELDDGIAELVAQVRADEGNLSRLPARLVAATVPEGHEDDIALLIARPSPNLAQRTAELDIPAAASALRDGRRFAAATLRDWAIPELAIESATLMVSELLTNAIVHGFPPIRLRLRRTPDELAIEVDDAGSAMPRKLQTTPDDLHGRGLAIVADLGSRWAARPNGHGKTVWSTLPVPSDPELAGGRRG